MVKVWRIRAPHCQCNAVLHMDFCSSGHGTLGKKIQQHLVFFNTTPFLFIILLDYVLRETLLDNIDGFTITPRRSSRYPAVRSGALVYVDDIAITCYTIDQAENVFRRLEMNASKVGLKINFKKTKILHAGTNSQPSPVTTINGYTLEICNDFLYLCVSTKTPLNVVQEKIGRAWFAIGKLRPIFISKISDDNIAPF